MRDSLRPLVLASLIALAACSPRSETATPAPPAAAPKAAATPAAPAAPSFELLPQAGSRFISIAPVDDGGTTSGRHALTICLPAGYDTSVQRYPVVYVLDGENAFQHRKMDMARSMSIELAHDQLVHDRLIQPVILVAIDNSMDASGNLLPGNRGNDYLPMRPNKETGGFDSAKAEAYYRFLAQTVKPFVDRTFRTRPEAASTCVAGMSYSGIGAFWMTFSHPETFGLGLCQTPSFWAVKEYLARNLDRHQGPRPEVRLWLDAGSQEPTQWTEGFDVYAKLLGLGFTANETVAFQTGHVHYHTVFDASLRLRAALYFLFRTKAPRLTGAEIVDIDATTGGPIQLARPMRAAVELVYDGWFRLTDATRTFTIADQQIVAQGDAPNAMLPKTPGTTTISATVDGVALTQTVTVLEPTGQAACPRAAKAPAIDGDLSDWSGLPIAVDRAQESDPTPVWTGTADLSYRFGCAHDDDFVYIAIATVDDRVVSTAGREPWSQDGVEVRLDARPEAKRVFGRGEKEFTDILLLAISPTMTGESPARLPVSADKLPPGTKVVCVQTATGHSTEIAIPAAYLKSMCGAADWTAFRLNIDVNDRDDPAVDHVEKFWWQPDWRTLQNTMGSGTFSR